MAAHRYWRATAFEAYGAGDLEMSEFHLLAGGVRVDATATLTASVAPDVSGVLANLQDDVLSTAARWSAQAVKGLTLQWDFGGAPADVDDIRLAGDSELRFPLVVKLQWSDDASAWVDQVIVSGATWPGMLAITQSIAVSDSGTLLSLHMDGADASSIFIDASGSKNTIFAVGGASITTVESVFSGASLALSGLGQYLKTSSSPVGFNFGADDFAIEFFLKPTNFSADMGIFGKRSGTNYGPVVGYISAGSGYPNFLASLDGATWGVFLSGTSALSLGNFSFLQAKRTGDLFQLLINNVVVASVSKSGALISNSAAFAIGSAADDGGPTFNGRIDEVRVSGRSRPAAIPTQPFGGQLGIKKNTVMGFAASASSLVIGTCPTMTYGTPKIALPNYLSVESGSIKDQITGVLGEGIGRVKGTAATKGSPNQPVHRKVRLIRERDGVVIREAWSNAVTGEYDFQYVDEAQTYTVVSYDHLHNYRAVIADNLTPELMP